MKKIALLSVIILFVWLLYVIANIANGGIGRIPNDGEVISEKYNVCLRVEPNKGSGDWLNMFTYFCDKRQRVIDSQESGECVDIYLENVGDSHSNVLHIKRSFNCALSNIEGSEEKSYIVNEFGKFVLISP